MTGQDAETDPDSHLLHRALPAIARLEASLADEREASRLALHSANLLDTLTNLSHAIAEESEQLNALDLIAPGMWSAEEFHSRIISWLLDPSAHHRQAGHFVASTHHTPEPIRYSAVVSFPVVRLFTTCTVTIIWVLVLPNVNNTAYQHVLLAFGERRFCGSAVGKGGEDYVGSPSLPPPEIRRR